MTLSSLSLEGLLAPKISVDAVASQGGVYAKYETDFSTYAAKHWTLEGANWDQANYYDRAEIFYNWYNRTGDTSYLTKANALAVNYRDNYLKPNDYGPSAHWSQIAGVALHYVATGDEASRTAVGRVADSFAFPYYLDNLGDRYGSGPVTEMDNRVQARTLEAFLYAKQINAPSADGNDWDSLLHSSLTKLLSSQNVDGAYRFDSFGGYVKPFMVGILNDTLIDYYTRYEADPRILTAVQKSLDWLWNNMWDEATQSFLYLQKSYGGEISEPAPDLNNMISSGFGWVYKMTGDATYKARGNAVFAGGVNGAWLDGSKQFNEEYTSSLKYLAYTLNTVGVEQSASVTTPPIALSLLGSSADDTLEGSSGQDKLYGNGGNDTLIGRGGGDYLDGGSGTDTASYASAEAAVLADLNDASSNRGDAAGDTYVSIENLVGGAYADRLYGNAAPNVLNGAGGPDTLVGGLGNDTYVVDNAGDVVIETSTLSTEIDTVRSCISYTLNVNVESLALTGTNAINGTGNALANRIIGNAAANVLNGGGGADSLSGGLGNDTIVGGSAADVLAGCAGADTLTGGSGADRFVFSSAQHSSTSQRDIIRDFERGIDRIDLRNIDGNVYLAGDQAFVFIGSSSFSGVTGQLRFAKGLLSGDINGDKVVDFQVSIAGVSVLANSDFYL